MNAIGKYILGFFVFGFVFASNAYASPYGDCAYGGNTYNNQCPTPTPTTAPTPTPTSTSNGNSASSSSGSSTGSNSPGLCTAQAPLNSPNLYQVDRFRTSATLYFSPPAGTVTAYVVSYGYKVGDETFLARFNHSENGAVTYTINELSIYQTYAFKVKAENGCAGSSWSNYITASKNPALQNRKFSSYPSLADRIYFPIQNNLRSIQKKFHNAANNSTDSESKKSPTVKKSAPAEKNGVKPKTEQAKPPFWISWWNFLRSLFN